MSYLLRSSGTRILRLFSSLESPIEGEKLVLLKLSQSLKNGEYHPFKYLEYDVAPEIKILSPLFGKLREP